MTLRRRPTPEEVEEASQGFGQDERLAQVRELLPRLDWHKLWESEEEEEWLLHPLIPARRLIALFSPAKVGKSLLMLEIAAALSTGRKALGHDPGRRIRVLYVDFENDPRGDVRTRLEDMGYGPGDLDYLDYLSFPSLPYLDSEAGAAALLAGVEVYGPELVVIDTISRAVRGEENDNDTWLNLYKHTGLALKRAQVAMIRLDHTGKDEAKGQRGGSAKAGDVDAIWKLTTVVKDKEYLLACMDSRFSLETKELTLTRHDDPLHHKVKDTGVGGGTQEAKILDVLKRIDEAMPKVPTEISNKKLMEWGQARGLKYGKTVYELANKRRKNSAELAFDPQHARAQHAVKADPGPAGVGGQTNVDPRVSGSAGVGTNGNGKTPNQKPILSTPASGGQSGAAPSADLTPDPPLYKRGSGHGVACEECGWDRIHKAVCSRNPTKRDVADD